MKLSIIIVNYNVQHFLEQCLQSVRKAVKNVPAEIFVVDNNSVDGSVAMVKSRFPEVILIENKKNTGFSFANNQAIKESHGEYVLLLNPDTLVEEDTFEKVVKFMDEHPEGGGLGVYMIDGSGNYLPESKRGLPTPAVAFYKIFGLAALFPKSEKFGRYHLGYLDKNKIHEIEVLSGAFMMLRKTALDKIGLLDETFFMYGEDIDLSYRIIKGGYKNYYFPETRIIHYKGESTKKSSVNYVFVFYRAMVIFAKKHFSQSNVRLFSFLINLAIYLRAGAAVFNRFLKRIALPLTDGTLIFAGLYLLKEYWENVVKSSEGLHFANEVITIAFPLYIFIWLASVFYSGGYDKPLKYPKIIKGIAIGTGIILIIYALLSESYRFSRALILLGSVWSVFSIYASRFLLHLMKIEGYDLTSDKKKRVIVVGRTDEFKRISSILAQGSINPSFIGNVVPDNIDKNEKSDFLGNIGQLEDIVLIYEIDEVIFCAKDLPSQQIISLMAQLGNSKAEFKIAPPESLYIIGSNSIDTNGELYVININSIVKESNQRSKRLFDVLSGFAVILCSPVLILLVRNPIRMVKNIFSIITGKKSFVGYYFDGNITKRELEMLPVIKKGVLHPLDAIATKQFEQGVASKINYLYAKDYSVYTDVTIVLKGIRNLGRE